MDKMLVYGGKNKLKGTVEIQGAKNAVLPIMAASLLAQEGVTLLKAVPKISDIYT
ncbi:MAG: UDP-N-acetylglucosamine 1-carboxyvinyltransferase, partial [Streptococcaceae bacterium]|nr:UDP-N-acetylglucosamine 1-carboxyvinyltransferase [Streptococcaceae bacterium]